MCIRTRSYDDTSNPESAYTGAKLAIYSKWLYPPTNPLAPVVDGTNYTSLDSTWITQDHEYYDYENYGNRVETGNDYYDALTSYDKTGTGSGAAAHQLLTDMAAAFGNLEIQTSGGVVISGASGLVATVLTRPLLGKYKTVYLSVATIAGLAAWFAWAYGVHELGSCTS
jgi:hypothetical protein